MSTKRSTSRQSVALAESPPPFSLQRTVPANQRFSRRPAIGQPSFTAAAHRSDDEADSAQQQPKPTLSKQTAPRLNAASGKATAGGAASSKQAAAAPTGRLAKRSGTAKKTAAKEQREERPAEDEQWEAEEEEDDEERQQRKPTKAKKDTALTAAATARTTRGTTRASAAERGKSRSTAVKDDEPEQRREVVETATRSGTRGQAAALRETADLDGGSSKRSPAKPQDKPSVGSRAARKSGNVAELDKPNTARLNGVMDGELSRDRAASRTSARDPQSDNLSAVALLRAFSGDVELPHVEIAVANRRSERGATAERKAPAVSSRRRSAKHVSSGLDATAELYYKAEQTEGSTTHSETASTRRGKAVEGEQAGLEKENEKAEEVPQHRGLQHGAGMKKQPADEADEQVINDEAGGLQADEAAAAGADEPVGTVLEPLRGSVLLISARPDVYEQYKALAVTLGAQVVERLSSKVSHVVWDEGDEKLLARVERKKKDKRPYVVSYEWLNTTAVNGEAAFESIWPPHVTNQAEQDSQQHAPVDTTEAAHSEQQTADSEVHEVAQLECSNEDGEQQRMEAADVTAETAQQLPDSSFSDTAGRATEEAEQGTEESRSEEEPLKPLAPGWSRKRKDKSSWAESDSTTSLTQYEKDKAAEDRQRMEEGASKEVEDDVDAADDEANWIDDNGDESKRDRKKAGRRYLRERERTQRKAQQPPVDRNHNLQNESLGMVKFEPSTFDESAIQDLSERHALLSPLTEDDEEETESGSSSEFECSDVDSSGGNTSSSSDDAYMSEMVDDKYDDRRAETKRQQKKRKGKKKRTKVVKGAGRGKRVQTSKRDRSSSDEYASDESDEAALDSDRVAARHTSQTTAASRSQKKQRMPVEHAVAAPPPTTRQHTIAFSALTAEKAKHLGLIAKHLRGFSLQRDSDDDVASHVLVDSSKLTRTRKVLFGIARGSWILDCSWLLDYVGQDGQLLNANRDGMVEPEMDEVKYEVQCWPGAQRSRLLHEQAEQTLLFDREKVFIAYRTALGQSRNEQLVYLCGGLPVSHFFDCCLCLCADDFVLGDLGEQLVGLPSAAFRLPIVTTEWLYDCISEGARKPLDGYRRYTHPELNEEEQLGEDVLGSPAV